MNSNTVTDEMIDKIVEETEFKTIQIYGKTTIVSAKLPNGFVITESSSCVDPVNYDEKLGEEICKNRIIDKIWEFEGYKLQDKIYRESQRKKELRECTIRELIDNGWEVQLTNNLNRINI